MALLDKFFQPGGNRSRTLRVVDHLTRLLNTKRGFGSWQQGFGLEGYSGTFSHHQLAEKIATDISETIELYEKRIRVHSIESDSGKDVLNMRFRIYCTIEGIDQKLAVAFENKKEQITVEVDEDAV